MCLNSSNGKHHAISALIDTEATNSLLHESVVRKHNIPIEPVSIRLCTASGLDENAIIGKCHLQFILHDSFGNKTMCCTNFIVSRKLNNLQFILGAKFLISETKSVTINKGSLSLNENNVTFVTPIYPDESIASCEDNFSKNICSDMTCGNCETNPVFVPDKTIYVKNLILSETDDLKIITPQFDNEMIFYTMIRI